MDINYSKEQANANAQLGHSDNVLHHNNIQKVQKKQLRGQLKKKAKQQRKAREALQRTMNDIHAPTKGHHARLAARRWVQRQLDSRMITGQAANELWHFLKDRELKGVNKGSIEKEDLSTEAKASWIRYLQELTIPAGVRVDVGAIFATGGTGGEALDGMERAEERDDRVMVSPEPAHGDQEAATEGEDKEDGGVMLGPLALRPKENGCDSC